MAKFIGRPHKPIDWSLVDTRIVLGERSRDLAVSLRVSLRHLQNECEREKQMKLGQYVKLIREDHRLPNRPFSVTDIANLLRAYYSKGLAKNDSRERQIKLKGIRYRPPTSPSTGPSLFDLVTYPQMIAVMTAMANLSLQIGGVTVRDGYEYPLKVWIHPQRQSDELPDLMEYYERLEYWRPTPMGYDLIAKALISFEKEFYKQVLNHGESSLKETTRSTQCV